MSGFFMGLKKAFKEYVLGCIVSLSYTFYFIRFFLAQVVYFVFWSLFACLLI